jgi:hypothetical protein
VCEGTAGERRGVEADETPQLRYVDVVGAEMELNGITLLFTIALTLPYPFLRKEEAAGGELKAEIKDRESRKQ